MISSVSCRGLRERDKMEAMEATTHSQQLCGLALNGITLWHIKRPM